MALRGHFHLRQREIKLSLRTCDRAIAFVRARQLHVRIDSLFLQLRETMAGNGNPFRVSHFDLGFDEQNRIKVTNIKPGEESAAVAALRR